MDDTQLAQSREDLLKMLETSEVAKLLEQPIKDELIRSINRGSEDQLLRIKEKLMEYERSLQENQQELGVLDTEIEKRDRIAELKKKEAADRVEAEAMTKKLLAELDAMK